MRRASFWMVWDQDWHGMKKVKKLLCIHPEPAELRISALLNRKGLAVELTEADTPASIERSLQHPTWWDLILCDEQAFGSLDIAPRLAEHANRLDASLILLKSSGSPLTPAKGFVLGAADVVVRDDIDHLLTVCERELQACKDRKQLRDLRHSVLPLDSESRRPVVLATISDLSSRLQHARSSEPESERLDPARVKSLIEAGGLVLEYQPIVSFRADQEHRNMFETLVRLKDERGHVLLPGAFLPLVAEAGWMGKIDLWIVGQSLVLLQRMQAVGTRDMTLFLNLANQTLRSEQIVEAIGSAIAKTDLCPVRSCSKCADRRSTRPPMVWSVCSHSSLPGVMGCWSRISGSTTVPSSRCIAPSSRTSNFRMKSCTVWSMVWPRRRRSMASCMPRTSRAFTSSRWLSMAPSSCPCSMRRVSMPFRATSRAFRTKGSCIQASLWLTRTIDFSDSGHIDLCVRRF
jgi:hypothetical protein